MSRIMDTLMGRRDTAPAPRPMIGFPLEGGLVSAGVSGTTALGLSSVWRCLDILSNGVSQLDWQEVRGNLELPNSRIVNQPESQRTRREWVSIVVSTLALYDVCYLLPVGGYDSEGVPLGLWYIQPNLIMPKAYDMWSLELPDEFYLLGKPIRREQLVILHRSPQPLIFDNMGGVIQLARTTFAAAQASENYASRYWQSGGSPTTVLETDAVLDSTKATELSDSWYDRRAKGPDYAPVLTSGLKAKNFGADPTALAAVEARKQQVADIGRYFGIPTHILNSPQGDTETYSNTESGNQDLVRYTLQNYIGAIEDAISSQLPGGRKMKMDTWRLRSGTQLAQAQSFQLALGGKAWMTQDEVREVNGLPPVENPTDLDPIVKVTERLTDPTGASPVVSGPPGEPVKSGGPNGQG